MDQPITLITGGTGGLGQAVTQAFLQRGDRVIVTWSSERGRDELRQLTDSQSVDLTLLPANVTDEASVNALFSRIEQDFQRLDNTVHLVGGFAGGLSVAETSLETFDHMVAMNFKSAFLVLRAAAALMQSQRSGHIVTVASRSAIQVAPGIGVYAASKAALVALTQTLALELGPFGINANVVLPGTIDTPANRRAMPDADPAAWTKPERIAQTILTLCSPTLSGVNGVAIPIS
ncbi:MAG TPA: SDR family oxidoreductase [Acidobacteriota bacterium]|nr:SDR family oxidoreductase [Acidobacteriota bacterium]HMZ80704.1 SDR family oxidoreductase [Acidobacteriota bacterium]HNB71120.1 SDR family oxidoreductase [Acidobacteriota bacterium]HNG94457.1 SDR family oxidoreductase [Acidobacteriota bacterium]HNH85157.1 SDR family oxidoreductase [Acidobacteriota bacterium]